MVEEGEETEVSSEILTMTFNQKEFLLNVKKSNSRTHKIW